MIETRIQTETIDDITNNTNLLNVLSWFEDEDFNGNNGKDYLWDEAEELGYESNQEYVLYEYVAKESEVFNKIKVYFDMWLEHDSCYVDYQWDLHQVKDNTYTLTLVRVSEN